MMSFNLLPSQQPQTLAYALADSPVGLLGWLAQRFGESLDPDFVLAHVAIHWPTGTAASAVRFCYEEARSATAPPSGPTTTPTGLAMFAGDFRSIRRFAEHDTANIVSWHSYDQGVPAGGPRDARGHDAAHGATDVLVGDVRRFFAALA